MIKKHVVLGCLVGCMMLVSCHKQQSDRYDPQQSYERFINTHVFAACEAIGTPQTRYSLASIIQRPQYYNSPYYKIRFINGPCKGAVGWTKEVIRKTSPVGEADFIPTGTVVLRNFDNPKEPYNKDITDHWNLAVIVGKDRADKGILDVGFPRDSNDFFPARESIYSHNIRVVNTPPIKDIRHFIK